MMLNPPEAGCQCPGQETCVCSPVERALRAWANSAAIAPMTADQRAWCMREIDSVEGYLGAEHAQDSDADLARTVLRAWTDFIQDKGLR